MKKFFLISFLSKLIAQHNTTAKMRFNDLIFAFDEKGHTARSAIGHASFMLLAQTQAEPLYV